MVLKDKLKEATLKKASDSLALFSFKKENSRGFKAFDSLEKLNQVTPKQQRIHDSTFRAGINLAMQIVRDQMKINVLKKELE